MAKLTQRLCEKIPSTLNGFQINQLDWTSFSVQDGPPDKLVPGNRHQQLVRICDQAIGGFVGRTVLELGPQEAAITTAINQHFATEIVAIEPQWTNYLKCLIVKEHFQLANARFLLGDPMSYLQSCHRRFDVAIVTGVLFRSPDPCNLLDSLLNLVDTIAINTVVYDPNDKIHGFTGMKRSFTTKKTLANGAKEVYELHQRIMTGKQKAESMTDRSGREAAVLSRDDLIRFLQDRGFETNIFLDVCHETSGSRIGLIARCPEQ